MYGGGFATVPAYLADIFGPRFVGAIHGRLLTAWSTAGVVGPFLVGYIRDAQLQAGVERALVYDRTLYILSSFLIVGFLCNAFISPVASKWLMRAPVAASTTAASPSGSFGIGMGGGLSATTLAAWLAVGAPIAWGVWQTLQSAVKIFQ